MIAALEADGRALDDDQLAADLGLSSEVADIARQLAAFGDEGEQIHAFGAVRVALITAGSMLGRCDLTTFVMASRRAGHIADWCQDENADSPSDLGIGAQPLSMLEAIVLVEATLLAQAPYPYGDSAWRAGYFTDPTMHVQVRSAFHPHLHAWYEQRIAEWLARQHRS